MAATAAARVEAAPRVEARGVGLRAGLVTVAFLSPRSRSASPSGRSTSVVGAILRSALSYVPFLHVHQPLGAVDHAVIWQLRAPRVALAALVGGMLAVAGASYQGVFRNPLCDPYLLGVAGGAGLGATLAIVYGAAAAAGGSWTVPLAAFVGAIAAVIITYALGRSVGATQMTGALVLAGVTMATFTAAVQTFVQQQHTQQLQNVYSWLLGRFLDRYLARRRDLRALHRGELARARPASPRARRLQPRRRRGVEPRDRRSASARLTIVVAATLGTAAAVSVERPDRVRRDHRPAHDPSARLDELPRGRPALAARRCRLPRAGGRRRAHRPLAGRAADRRRHRLPRCAVLRPRPAHARGRAR